MLLQDSKHEDLETPIFAENHNLEDVHTPVDGRLLARKLREANYDLAEIEFLEHGFTKGFNIGYEGPTRRRSEAKNIPLRIGSPTQLWNKLIKEVQHSRIAGPFDSVPFEHFMQSPIGLVPKAKDQTRLTFHLSYDFGTEIDQRSVNFHTPAEKCSVKYQDLDCAAKMCLRVKAFKMKNLNLFIGTDKDGNEFIYLGKSDIKSAFHLLCLDKSSWRWLVMKA